MSSQIIFFNKKINIFKKIFLILCWLILDTLNPEISIPVNVDSCIPFQKGLDIARCKFSSLALVTVAVMSVSTSPVSCQTHPSL